MEVEYNITLSFLIGSFRVQTSVFLLVFRLVCASQNAFYAQHNRTVSLKSFYEQNQRETPFTSSLVSLLPPT